ncbi:Di-copper centre-containing protein [Wolfiporia cocos MD-104 SS10]|uniref:tyrosinase n=1 Tax=Wolfiporia cocos (strain MD-104) TaxID=742152 RepID=A0A2H3J1M4_WOLCO|nr:Di-copper centre-containing protein [Wolfiporia cocos MD-104 SS10]
MAALGGVKGPPMRKEIRDLAQDERQFSLYIQALNMMMEDPKPNFLSFDGAGGIPDLFRNYLGGLTGFKSIPGDLGGYGTRESTPLPARHRPPITLYEQRLSELAMTIAQGYETNQQDWLRSATNLRAPYWDWALPNTAGQPMEVPTQMQALEVEIMMAGGVRKLVSNPLYSYRDPPKPDPELKFGSSFDQWEPNAIRDTSFDCTYRQNAPCVRDQVYRCLRQVRGWSQLSGHDVTASADANGLESIHDTMQDVMGGGVLPQHATRTQAFDDASSGVHMSDFSAAGFDAASYLHHANVDRLASLWSAMNYKVQMSEIRKQQGMFAMKADSFVGQNTSFTPFWGGKESYSASSSVHAHEGLYYSYPEFAGLGGKTSDEIKANIEWKVESLYGTRKKTRLNVGRYYEWTLHFKFKRFEIGRSFALLVFLEEVYVGPVSAFVDGNAETWDNVDAEMEGFVHLNEVLVENYPKMSAALPPEEVEPLLAENLSYRLVGSKPDGTRASIDDLKSLRATTFVQTADIPSLDPIAPDRPRYPIMGTPVYCHDLLRGKPGHVLQRQWNDA